MLESSFQSDQTNPSNYLGLNQPTVFATELRNQQHSKMTTQQAFNPDNLPYLDPKKDRKVALITGGNSGVGYFTTLHLYLHGYIVYVGGRNKERTTTAIEKIKNEADLRIKKWNSSTTGGEGDGLKVKPTVGELHYLPIDLVDLKSVDEAAKQFLSQETGQLNLLIHNAGIMATPFNLTKDNFEEQIQTNCISPLLLTDRLKKSMTPPNSSSSSPSSSTTPPRIVFLSSLAHTSILWHIKPEDKLQRTPDFFWRWIRYGQSKLVDIYLAKCLSKRYPQILSTAVHPGVITETGLYKPTLNSVWILS
ncbi:unnamed protein product [Ambrosiozyma monospora]|uniref:Unnamed protein product n=1 Tax=Ambrosiozyma monospora TaxID=43982 RepID=A0ACB5T2M8_AMBMO|nr:unnamed protein product [Ambrosiozyma monospora]